MVRKISEGSLQQISWSSKKGKTRVGARGIRQGEGVLQGIYHRTG